MRRIENHNLSVLLAQLRFTPEGKRRGQLSAVQELLAIIDPGKEYPFEFVCFKITGFHPKNLPPVPLIKGASLVDDLRIFISKLSSQLAQPVSLQSEKIYSIEELAKELEVSTKTIDRWRKRGLIALKYIFDDGVKRFGFSRSIVDKFVEANPELTRRANAFRRLDSQQKRRIIEYAKRLNSSGGLSRHRIIEEIAVANHLAHETVRYTILNHDLSNSGKAVFSDQKGVIKPSVVREIYESYKQGTKVAELMTNYSRSKSSIYRIINQVRARKLLAIKTEFVDSEEFLEESSAKKILSIPLDEFTEHQDSRIAMAELSSGSISEYLEKIKDVPELNREQEINLFRRYNYLKYLFSLNRTSLKASKVSSLQVKKLETYFDESELIKNILIEFNLRLVLSIANKHSTSGVGFSDLVSVGSYSLVRAVQKFDYSKGYRFSTYASWAIAKDFAREMPTKAGRSGRVRASTFADVDKNLRIKQGVDFGAIERAHNSLVQVVRDNLDEREQYIILNHFGLIGSLVKKQKKTLAQIGVDLGLSKERVRQIELLALQKLRHSLSDKEFEMLTG